MSMVASGKVFAEALQSVSSAIGASKHISFFGHVRMFSRNAVVVIQAQSNERFSERIIKADVLSPFDLLLEGKALSLVAQGLSEDDVHINPDGKGATTVKQGGIKARIPGMDPQDWPEMAKPVADDVILEIESGAFTSMAGPLVMVAGDLGGQPQLVSILVEVKEERLTCVATNTHHLAYSGSEWLGPDSSFMIHKNMVKAIGRLSGTLKFYQAKGGIIVRSEHGSEYHAGETAGYPNWRKAMPKETPLVATVDRMELLNAVKRVVSMATPDMTVPVLWLDSSDKCVRVVLGINGEGREYEERVTGSVIGGKPVVILGTYVTNLLSTLDSKSVRLMYDDPGKPGFIMGEDEDRGGVYFPLGNNRVCPGYKEVG